MIPARIETSRKQQKDGRRSFLIKFSHVADQNQARQLRKMPVFVSREKIGEAQEDQSLKRLVAFTVRNEENREAGIVEDVLDNPAHPILVIQNDGKEILVPFVDEYITDIDEDKAIVYGRKINQLAEIA